MRKRLWIAAGVVLVVAVGAVVLLRRGGGEAEEGGGGADRPTPVVTARAQQSSVTRSIEGVADVEAAEAVTITAEAAGRIVSIHFREGQRVARGAVLVRLESDQEAADVGSLQAEAAELRGRLARLDGLAREGAVPRGTVDDLRRQLQAAEARAASARTVLNDTVIRAPFSGVVGLREVSPGALVQPGAELVTLDNLDSVKVRFTLPEQALARVRIGSPVQASTPAYPEQSFAGQITAFDSRLNPEQRTLGVQAVLPNPGGRLRPGMLANVRVDAETAPNAVTVPPLAVQVRGAVQFVYRVVDGCAQRAEVTVGQRDPERIEITRGLKAGEAVVVEGFAELSTGSPVVERSAQQRQQQGDDGEDGGKSDKGEEKSGKGDEPSPAERCRAVLGLDGQRGGGEGGPERDAQAPGATPGRSGAKGDD